MTLPSVYVALTPLVFPLERIDETPLFIDEAFGGYWYHWQYEVLEREKNMLECLLLTC